MKNILCAPNFFTLCLVIFNISNAVDSLPSIIQANENYNKWKLKCFNGDTSSVKVVPKILRRDALIDSSITKVFYSYINNSFVCAEYKNGKPHGYLSSYDENGILIELSARENGDYNGDYQLFINGKNRMKSFYLKNALHGKVTTYHENGEIESVNSWKNNKKNGKEFEYYNNGDVMYEVDYLNNELVSGGGVYYEKNNNDSTYMQYEFKSKMINDTCIGYKKITNSNWVEWYRGYPTNDIRKCIIEWRGSLP